MADKRPVKEERIPDIKCVTPLEGYRLKIEFTSGSVLILNMEDRLGSMRFCPLENLEVFNSVSTDGYKLIFDTYPKFEVEMHSDAAIRLALDVPPRMRARLRNERKKGVI